VVEFFIPEERFCMTQQRPDRQLPDNYFNKFVRAVRDEIGDYSLQFMLKNADLMEWQLENGDNSPRNAYAADMAILQSALRHYYGSGARGILIRTGAKVWELMVDEATGAQKASLLVMRSLPLQARRMRILEFLADRMGGESDQSFVYPMDPNLIFMDHFSDPTFGQDNEDPICWFTVGLIQAALYWITGAEHVVEEISCTATGDKACRFEIWQ
jgi:hypothetical protein